LNIHTSRTALGKLLRVSVANLVSMTNLEKLLKPIKKAGNELLNIITGYDSIKAFSALKGSTDPAPLVLMKRVCYLSSVGAALSGNFGVCYAMYKGSLGALNQPIGKNFSELMFLTPQFGNMKSIELALIVIALGYGVGRAKHYLGDHVSDFSGWDE
jgi:hypothetical protein